MNRQINSRGFTLIELVVVMLAIAIITSIAIPSYTRYVTKSRRAAAEACLSNYANFMEVYYASNMTYVGASLPALDCASSANTGNYYTYAPSGTASQNSYTVKATAKGTQAKNDAACATLKLDNGGGRQPLTGCW